MLNYIWFGMMAIAVAAGIYNGKIDAARQGECQVDRDE